jgi:hypothetical protein
MLVQKQEPGRRIACGVSRRDVTGSGHFSRGGPGGPEPYVGARPGPAKARLPACKPPFAVYAVAQYNDSVSTSLPVERSPETFFFAIPQPCNAQHDYLLLGSTRPTRTSTVAFLATLCLAHRYSSQLTNSVVRLARMANLPLWKTATSCFLNIVKEIAPQINALGSSMIYIDDYGY